MRKTFDFDIPSLTLTMVLGRDLNLPRSTPPDRSWVGLWRGGAAGRFFLVGKNPTLFVRWPLALYGTGNGAVMQCTVAASQLPM